MFEGIKPNNPYAWLDRLRMIDDEIEPVGEDKALLEKILPEDQRDEFDDVSAGLAFVDDDAVRQVASKEFDGSEGLLKLEAALALQPIEEQFDFVAALTARQKAAVTEVGSRLLESRNV